MDEIVKLLSQKTGLPEDKARLAVETVVGYLKQRLPGSIGQQLDASLAAPAAAGLGEKVKGIAESVGGVFKKTG